MAKTDAEISLKVNVPPPNSFEKALQAFNAISKNVNESLKETGEKVKDISEATRILRERSTATGSESVQRVVSAGFSQTTIDEAANLDKRAEKIGENFGKLEEKVIALKQAFDEGRISEEAAAKQMEYFVRVARKGDEAASSLVYDLHTVEGDLHELAQMDDVLGVFDGLRGKMEDVSGGARILSDNLKRQADALAEQREALNATAPGYEQASAALLKQETELRKASAAALDLGASAEKSFRKVKESLQGFAGGTEETAKLMADMQNRQAQMESQERKLQGLQDDTAKREQQRLAQKEVETEKEIELSRKKEEQEQKAALKQQQLQEADMYRTELLGKTKLELAAIVKQLNADMVAAGKAEDWATLDVLKQKMSIARSAMRNASMQANITRMTFMQQAQTAERLGGNISSLTTGISNFSEALEKGEVDLTGMSSQMMNLWFTMKAGMGPIGWAVLGLEALERMLNNTGRSRQEVIRLANENRAAIEAEAAMYDELAKAMQAVEDEKELKQAVADIEAEYSKVNTALERSVELIDEALQKEQQKNDLLKSEQDHQRKLQKLELDRRLASGEIDKAQYNRALLTMDKDAAIQAAEKEKKDAQAKEKAEKEKAEQQQRAFDKQEGIYETAKSRASAYDVDAEIVKQRMAAREKLEAEYKKAQEGLRAATKERTKDKSIWQKGAEGGEALLAWTMGDGVLGFNLTTAQERRAKEHFQATKNRNARKAALDKFDKETQKLLHGKTVDNYLKEQKETQERLKTATEQFESAKSSLDKANEDYKNAVAASKSATENLGTVTRRENELANAKVKNLEAQEKIEADKQRNAKEAKAIQNQIEKVNRYLREMSAGDLDELLKNAKKDRGKYGDKTPQREAYDRFIRNIKDELFDRAENVRKQRKTAYAEAYTNKRGVAQLDAFDFEGVSATLDDRTITPKEAAFLKKQLGVAFKAGNATAAEFIASIVTLAVQYKENQGAVHDALKTLKKKSIATAQKQKKQIQSLNR